MCTLEWSYQTQLSRSHPLLIMWTVFELDLRIPFNHNMGSDPFSHEMKVSVSMSQSHVPTVLSFVAFSCLSSLNGTSQCKSARRFES